MGPVVRGPALVANDGFSARYDLDRIKGTFSRPAHKLAGQSYVGKVLVLDTAKGGPADPTGVVEFRAVYRQGGQTDELHERSRFVRVDGAWVYVGPLPLR